MPRLILNDYTEKLIRKNGTHPPFFFGLVSLFVVVASSLSEMNAFVPFIYLLVFICNARTRVPTKAREGSRIRNERTKSRKRKLLRMAFTSLNLTVRRPAPHERTPIDLFLHTARLPSHELLYHHSISCETFPEALVSDRGGLVRVLRRISVLSTCQETSRINYEVPGACRGARKGKRKGKGWRTHFGA